MRKYIAARRVEGVTEILGVVLALNVAEATERARRRWPDSGVLPWKATTREQRGEAKLQGQRKLGV